MLSRGKFYKLKNTYHCYFLFSIISNIKNAKVLVKGFLMILGASPLKAYPLRMRI